jgi:hypothetical protein
MKVNLSDFLKQVFIEEKELSWSDVLDMVFLKT